MAPPPETRSGCTASSRFLQATAVTGNGAGTPTGSFAGLSCVPGQYGGTWNPGGLPAWPNGRGDAQYDFYSPIIVDYNDTLFSTTHLWADACVEAISFGIIKTKKSKSQKGMLDVIFVDDEMYRKYIAKYRQTERIVIERQADKLARWWPSGSAMSPTRMVSMSPGSTGSPPAPATASTAT